MRRGRCQMKRCRSKRVTRSGAATASGVVEFVHCVAVSPLMNALSQSLSTYIRRIHVRTISLTWWLYGGGKSASSSSLMGKVDVDPNVVALLTPGVILSLPIRVHFMTYNLGIEIASREICHTCNDYYVAVPRRLLCLLFASKFTTSSCEARYHNSSSVELDFWREIDGGIV